MQISIEHSLVFVLLSAIVVGAFVWLLGRSRTAVAVQQAVSESLGRLASSDQSLQFALQESDRLRNELASLENDCRAMSDELDILRDHLVSVRAHIKGLSEKNYQNLASLKSLDFVVMFVPVEPAFMLAATADQALFSDAFAKNVLLVSPSTLLATLPTIANIWRQEYQNRNAQAIAEQCAKLYDKLVGLVENIEDVGKRLEQVQKSCHDAHGKLSSGRGNSIRQADNINALGVKPSKQLPSALLFGTEDYQESVLTV